MSRALFDTSKESPKEFAKRFSRCNVIIRNLAVRQSTEYSGVLQLEKREWPDREPQYFARLYPDQSKSYISMPGYFATYDDVLAECREVWKVVLETDFKKETK